MFSGCLSNINICKSNNRPKTTSNNNVGCNQQSGAMFKIRKTMRKGIILAGGSCVTIHSPQQNR